MVRDPENGADCVEALVPRGDEEAVARGRDAELVASRGCAKAVPLRGDEEVEDAKRVVDNF